MAVLFDDQFNRANVAPAAGALGANWTSQSGAIGINGNAAYVTSIAVNNIYTVTGGSQRDIDITSVNNVSSLTGLVFRYRDVNNHWRYSGNQLLRVVGGVSVVYYDSGLTAPAAGVVLRVAAKGDQIKIWYGGVAKGTFMDDQSLSTDAGYGMRIPATSARIDYMTFSDSSAADFPSPPPGKVPSLGVRSMTKTSTPSWLYKGRDTKVADTGSNP